MGRQATNVLYRWRMESVRQNSPRAAVWLRALTIAIFAVATLVSVSMIAVPSALAQEPETVPPCTPWPESDRDPCERRVPWERPSLKYPIVVPLYAEPDPVPTIRGAVDEGFERPTQLPHQVVRGIVVPGSTRCASQVGRALSAGFFGQEVLWRPGGSNIRCFVDVLVREYLFGTGPVRITIQKGRRNNDHLHDDYATVPRDNAYFADISSPLANALEGYEWIFWLELPLDPTSGTWESSHYWSVQRLEDGSIAAVDRWSGRHSKQGTYADRLEIPIDRYAAEIKAARHHYDQLYDGKVSASQYAPDIIATSHRSDLIAYLRAIGTYDVPGFTPQPPPPARIPTDPPVGLKAELDLEGSVALSWSPPAVETVTGYKITRGVGNRDFATTIAITGPSDTTYTDTSAPMTAGVTYVYRVIALNDYGDSVASTPSSVQVPLPTVPPCTPWPESDRDPCERRVPWEWPELAGARIIPHFIAPNPPLTIRQEMDNAYKRWTQIPHHIVRGVVVPGSTRCASHDSPVLTVDRPDKSFTRFANATDITCFSDVSVHEYIVGGGPKRVTTITATRTNDQASSDFGTVPRDAAYLAEIASPIVERLEGYEWIFWLEAPLDPTWGVWESSNYSNVQRHNRYGQILAVSRWSGWYSEDETQHLDLLEPKIEDYAEEARNARGHYDRLYIGRVGESKDAPLITRDASRNALADYHSAIGLDDLPAFVPLNPPPAPIPTDPPVGLTAELGVNGSILLNWNPPSAPNVTGYKVVRRTATQTYVTELVTIAADTGSTATTYTDMSVPMKAGDTYTYRVVALNQYGESVTSNRATVQVRHTVTPPCTPWPESDRDPCERRVPWERPYLRGRQTAVLYSAPDPVPTIREAVDESFQYPIWLPHQLVRGIVIPGSTRCASQTGRALSGDAFEDEPLWRPNGRHIRCFVDVSVREYLVGTGPVRITIQKGRRNNDHLHDDYATVPRDNAYFADISSPLANALEGYEWIFWLELPLDPTSGTWESSHYWSVQRLEDGSIAAVDRWSGRHSKQGTYADRLEIPIDRYAIEVKEARRHYDLLYDGRVSASPTSPDIIATSYRSSLTDYLRSVGTYDVEGFTPQPPPSAPVPTLPTPVPTDPPPPPTIPPCTPRPESDRDPCERRVPWEWPDLKYPIMVVDLIIPDPPQTVRQEVDDSLNDWILIPHIVVRGVVVPGSTRCSTHSGTTISQNRPGQGARSSPYGNHIHCFSDVSVSEYIVGSGPRRVTFISERRPFDNRSGDFGEVPRDEAYFADITEPLVEAVEGYEWILWLEVPVDPTTETWNVSMRRSVQRSTNGDIVAVSRWHRETLLGSEYANRLDYPLDDYVAEMKSAMQYYRDLYGGKVADSPDAPSLILNADPGHLRHYLHSIGTYDLPGFTPSPPPPAPVPTDPPVGLTAELGVNGSVLLKWNAPSAPNVTSYKIVRCAANQEFVTVAADTGSTDTTYTDTTAPTIAGVSYTYRVIALNNHGASIASAPATVQTPGAYAPVLACTQSP